MFGLTSAGLKTPKARDLNGFGVYHKLTVWLVTVWLVTSCAPPNHNDDSDYAQRISNTLKVAQSIEALPYQPQVPPTWAKATETQQQLNLLEFISLTGCDLQHVIGDKNSNLGKHAPASVALLQTLSFLNAAESCISYLEQENKQELAQKIRAAANTKKAELAISIGQALFDGPEFSSFWRNPATPDYPNNLSSDLAATLQTLEKNIQQWLSGDYRYNSAELAQQLLSIKRGDGGALIHELQQTAFALEQASSAISHKMEHEPLCLQGKSTQAFTYFNNVVTSYFIGQIQPRNVVATKRATAVFGVLNRICLLYTSPSPRDA